MLRPGCVVEPADIEAATEAAGAARFKIPERIESVAAMPMTKVGKIDKKTLRDDIRARLARTAEFA